MRQKKVGSRLNKQKIIKINSKESTLLMKGVSVQIIQKLPIQEVLSLDMRILEEALINTKSKMQNGCSSICTRKDVY
jgi:hypothetical protein